MRPETVALLKGFRKVIVTLFVFTVCALCAWYGKLTNELSQVAIVALAGFTAANAFEHNAASKKP